MIEPTKKYNAIQFQGIGLYISKYITLTLLSRAVIWKNPHGFFYFFRNGLVLTRYYTWHEMRKFLLTSNEFQSSPLFQQYIKLCIPSRHLISIALISYRCNKWRWANSWLKSNKTIWFESGWIIQFYCLNGLIVAI